MPSVACISSPIETGCTKNLVILHELLSAPIFFVCFVGYSIQHYFLLSSANFFIISILLAENPDILEYIKNPPGHIR
jgi:hypothetical protein